ncbi:MAG: DUF1501 domain-containing protein, partial [Verrucomicrobia bacterium]|nr:DUF1501 domain-containing protein [Verrucomicrobiota bacterium]
MTGDPVGLLPPGRHLLDRRGFLSGAATGMGSLALATLLRREGLLGSTPPGVNAARPFAPRLTPSMAPARNVVMIFCAGAVSQLET